MFYALLIIGIGCLILFLLIISLRCGFSRKETEELTKVLPPNLEGKVIVLGCGWGSQALAVAQQLAKAQVDAYEISPLTCLYLWFRQRISKQKNLKVHWQDFFLSNFSDAQAVVCYLYPGSVERLQDKLMKELSPGTWVYCNTFAFPQWEAKEVLQLNDIYKTKIYIYQK